jgi:NAD+ kinase
MTRKFSFIASNTPDAQAAAQHLAALYGNSNVGRKPM